MKPHLHQRIPMGISALWRSMVVGGAVAVEDGGYVAMVVECSSVVRGKKNQPKSALGNEELIHSNMYVRTY